MWSLKYSHRSSRSVPVEEKTIPLNGLNDISQKEQALPRAKTIWENEGMCGFKGFRTAPKLVWEEPLFP